MMGSEAISTHPQSAGECPFMAAALAQARVSLAQGDFPVGTVLVHEGRVAFSGRNEVASGRDAVVHAEMDVLRRGADFLYSHRGECDLYTTLEPCMMCLGAAVFAGIRRVVYAVEDPGRGAAALLAQLPYYRESGLQLSSGSMGAASEELLRHFEARGELSR